MKIGIIVAMDKELHQLQQLFNDGNVRVEKCGIGKVNAALGAQRMINEFQPDCIISSGCAGGNGDEVNIQDVVVSTELCYHDVYCGRAIDDTTVYGQVQGLPARYQADPYLLQKAAAVANSSLFTPSGSHRHWRLVRGLPREGPRDYRSLPRCQSHRHGVVRHRPDVLY